MLTLKYQINLCYLQAAFFFIFPSCVPSFSNLEQVPAFPSAFACLFFPQWPRCLPVLVKLCGTWCVLLLVVSVKAKYQMLDQIGVFSFIRDWQRLVEQA